MSAMMSINAVKGVNIGSGMSSAFLTGEKIQMKLDLIEEKLNLDLIMLEVY